MYLGHLHVENVKLLRNVDLSFLRDGGIRKWTVFVGENGLCKSTLLQAIALAASGKYRANQLADVAAFPDRRSVAPARIEASFGFSEAHHSERKYPGLFVEKNKPPQPPSLESELWLDRGWKVFQGQSQYPGISDPGLDPMDEARGVNLPFWFVAGYGVSRTLPRPLSSERSEDPAVSRLDSLFDRGRLIGTGFADILPSPQDFVRVLRKVLLDSGLLPRISEMELQGRGAAQTAEGLVQAHRFEMQVGEKGVQIPATWLSHGYQSTIAWIADLIGQFFWEAAGPVEPEDMEGLVLIDEIDLHLHPKWQVELVPLLKKIFPRVQFIATTHSPMVLPGLEADEILVLKQDEGGNVVVSQPEQAPVLMTGSEIYNTFFGMDRLYPRELGEDLQRYGYLVGSPLRTDEEEQEMHRLRQRLREAGVDPGWEPTPRRMPSPGPETPGGRES